MSSPFYFCSFSVFFFFYFVSTFLLLISSPASIYFNGFFIFYLFRGQFLLFCYHIFYFFVPNCIVFFLLISSHLIRLLMSLLLYFLWHLIFVKFCFNDIIFSSDFSSIFIPFLIAISFVLLLGGALENNATRSTSEPKTNYQQMPLSWVNLFCIT